MGKAVDYLKIAVIAFAGIWIINHGLRALGKSNLEA